MSANLLVRVHMPTEHSYGNILWTPPHAARNGRFPTTHPVSPGASVFGGGDTQLGKSPTLTAFQERGYWASCFPEGDGITFTPKVDKEAAQVAADVREVFGFDVKVVAK